MGMYVCELDRPWLETPFLLQGFPLRTDRELETLRQLCRYVYVDTERSEPGSIPLRHETSIPLPASKTKVAIRETPANLAPPPTEPARFQDHLKKAARVRHKTHDYLRRTLEHVRLGEMVDTAEAQQLISELVEQVVEAPSAMVWMTQLRNRDEYTSIHSVNVCILALSFGRYLGLDKEMLNTVGMGALLHDIGKLCVPLEVLNKPGALTHEEFEIMKSHPAAGHTLLCEDPNVPVGSLEAVLYHHERGDGRGYPRGLSAEQIPFTARLVSIVDIYDAMCSDRVYHDGLPPQEALSRIYRLGGPALDRELVEAFIRCIGVYPIGALVELTTGEVAVIVGLNERQKLRPVVQLLLEADQRTPSERRLINLGSSAWRGHKDAPAVQRILEPGALGIDLTALILEQTEQPPSATKPEEMRQ